MSKQSAGILLYRNSPNGFEVFLVHPGGPFFKKKDDGVWSIPKGEFLDDEEPLTAARREFREETGFDIDGRFTKLKPVKLKSGKTVYAWAVEGDMDATQITSNNFEIEWPPSSGKMASFPEVDRAGWFTVSKAQVKIYPVQFPLIQELQSLLAL
jgi:predicted NUDIX family NTP pyrophosphohydrolase